jgi:hypothetical protein
MQSCNNQYWELKLPDDWMCEREDDTRIVYHPDRSGTLEISASLQPEPVGDEDLRYFASEQIEQGVAATKVACGDFSGIELIYEHDALFWREWFLRHGKILLLASYTCPPGEEEQDEAMLDIILATLRAP